jgi:rhodanese-related sulfurtransferase
MIEDLSPREVADRLNSEDAPLLVDVREGWERDLATIPGALPIRMADVPLRLDELPRERAIVVHCHHGARSYEVARWLEAHGYERLANLAGGIDAWSHDVDPAVPRY